MQSWWCYKAENTDHRSWPFCRAWYAASCMVEDKVPLWNIKGMTRVEDIRHTCWSVASTDAQSLDTEEDSAKRATSCTKFFITYNVL